MKMLILSVYKSPKQDEMYLYVEKAKGLNAVPDELRTLFGTPVHVMDMPLKEDRVLGRADTEKLMKEVLEKGFYLQMPPPREEYMLDLHKDTSHRYTGE
jgi:uncharacterized protein